MVAANSSEIMLVSLVGDLIRFAAEMSPAHGIQDRSHNDVCKAVHHFWKKKLFVIEYEYLIPSDVYHGY